ncbi:hypothetical protein HanIR_Chr16g0821821 [Helianthus annuus]|nr:hypothetical protein HanIR_Chr16g0821821 [Helianthus annuus]
MDLKLKIGKPDLIVSAITIRTMNRSLLLKTTRIIIRESFHELDCFVEFGNIVFIDQMSRRPDSGG